MQTGVLEGEVSPLARSGTGRRAATDEEFSEFFVATWPRMYRTALAIARDQDRAEDALQATYARAYAKWRSVSRTEHPEAYVRRMVVNEVLGGFRRSWWRLEHPSESPPETTPVASPEEATIARESMWTALKSLAPGQRAVLVLRYYEDLSEAEIARVLGISTGTVKSQAAAALAALRTKEITP